MHPEIQVFEQPCPLFVPLVENAFIDPGDQVTNLVAQRYLSGLRGAGVEMCIRYRLSGFHKGNLFYFYFSASLSQLSLQSLGIVLRNAFLDVLGSAVNQSLGFLQTQAGSLTDNLCLLYTSPHLNPVLR